MESTETPLKSLEDLCFNRTGSNAAFENFQQQKCNHNVIMDKRENEDDEMRANLIAWRQETGPVMMSLKNKREKMPRNLRTLISLIERIVLMCPDEQLYSNYTNGMDESLKPCFTTNEAETFHAYMTAIDATLEAICRNSSQQFQAFLEAGGFQQLADHEGTVDECYGELIIDTPNLIDDQEIAEFVEFKASDWCR